MEENNVENSVELLKKVKELKLEFQSRDSKLIEDEVKKLISTIDGSFIKLEETNIDEFEKVYPLVNKINKMINILPIGTRDNFRAVSETNVELSKYIAMENQKYELNKNNQ